MSSVLTEFVRRMGSGGPEPDQELFEQVWERLRGMLVGEMKRRGVWTSPPVFLGVVGHAHWATPGPGSDALDDLTARCFEWVFIQRIESLVAQAEQKPTIDGLVVLAVHHFVLEAQRRSDPLGFRVYEVLRRAVGHGVDAGALHVASGDERIRNNTILVTSDESLPDDPGEIHRVDPKALASSWIAEHLDELVTASHKSLTELVRTMADDLVRWLDAGRPGLRFGHLASALKVECRRAWAARLRDDHSFADANTPTQPPSTPAPDVLHRFALLADCVVRSIRRLDEKPKTQTYLERLWAYLANHTLDEDGEIRDTLELPSNRQLSSLLDIPRERLPGLLAILGGRLKACRRKIDATAEEPPMPQSDDPSSPKNRAWQQARATALRLREARGGTQQETLTIEPGTILSLPDADDGGVAWLVLEADSVRSCSRCAPVDRFGLLGPRDLPVHTETEPPSGDHVPAPWSLRRDFELWIEQPVLLQGRPLSTIDRAALGALLDDGDDDEGLQRVEASLPAYRDWIDAGPRPAFDRLNESGSPLRVDDEPAPVDEEPLPFPTPRKPTGRQPWALWIAAGLALAVLGLGREVAELRDMVSRLSRPLVDLPYGEVKFDSIPRGPRQIYVPEDATHVQIGMVISGQPDYPKYSLEVLGSDDRQLYRTKPLRAAGDYSITFTVDFLQPQPLLLRLYGVSKDGQDVFLDEEELVIVRGEAP